MFKLVIFLLVVAEAGLRAADGAEADLKSPPVKSAAAKPAAMKPDADGWIRLFDGKTLKGWQETDFAGRGRVVVTNGQIELRTGYMTGITWTNEAALIRMNYELSVEAKRTDGSDFFCGLTFPVTTNACTLVVGGWGGSLVGISCLDGEDAANNETTKSMEFKQDRWYHVRVQVKPDKILAWIDDEKLVDVITTDRRISVRLEMDSCVPLGVATWSTSGVLRNFKVRPLLPDEK